MGSDMVNVTYNNKFIITEKLLTSSVMCAPHSLSFPSTLTVCCSYFMIGASIESQVYYFGSVHMYLFRLILCKSAVLDDTNFILLKFMCS
jgi:hypothetical protein